VTFGIEPNLALLTPTGSPRRLYVSNDTTVYVHDAITGQKLAQFVPTRGLETMWGDDYDQVLYVPDENGRTGIYAYKPDGTVYTRNGASVFGNSSIFNSDAEGILEYTCPGTGTTDDGTGLIVVSDQIDSSTTGNDYEVFDRRTWAHLGTFKLRLPTGAFVHNTDGIGTTQQASAAYPGGVFTALQDDTSVAGVGWTKLFAAISAQTGSSFGCGTTVTPTSPPTVTPTSTSPSGGTGDTTAPTVIITSPPNGATVNGQLKVAATATDATRVTVVRLYLDGRLVGSDTTRPYSFSVSTRLSRGQHVLVARALDPAGNIGTSSPVTIIVR